METRDVLLQKALELFASRGYDAVGVQEVVEAAGVTKPTLYHYFGSKQGLLRAVLEKGFTPMDDVMREALEYRRDLTLNLEKLARAVFRFAEANPLWYRLQISLWFAPAESETFQCVRPHHERQHLMMEDLFLKAVADHGNMRGRHRAYAASFMGMLNTYVGFSLKGYLNLDDALAHAAVHQFQHGIYS